MIEDISKCYQILELEPGATLEEVKRSYRELVKVWHPDRFTNDPKLQKKAQEKLKLINLAYERICKGEDAEPRRRTSSAGASAPRSDERARTAGSSGSTGARSGPQREEPHHSSPQPPPIPSNSANKERSELSIMQGIKIFIIGTFVVGGASFIIGLVANLWQGGILGGPAPVPVEKQWRVRIMPSPKEVGEKVNSAQMIRNDSYSMEFIMFYREHGVREETRFIWDKKESMGKYEQKNPKGQGTWFLEPCRDYPNQFSGVVVDDKGISYGLILER